MIKGNSVLPDPISVPLHESRGNNKFDYIAEKEMPSCTKRDRTNPRIHRTFRLLDLLICRVVVHELQRCANVRKNIFGSELIQQKS